VGHLDFCLRQITARTPAGTGHFSRSPRQWTNDRFGASNEAWPVTEIGRIAVILTDDNQPNRTSDCAARRRPLTRASRRSGWVRSTPAGVARARLLVSQLANRVAVGCHQAEGIDFSHRQEKEASSRLLDCAASMIGFVETRSSDSTIFSVPFLYLRKWGDLMCD
jgi:hypothetical protein